MMLEKPIARTRLIFELAALARLPLRAAMVRTWFYHLYLKSYRQIAPFEEAEFKAWHRVMAAARLTEGTPQEFDTLLKFVQGDNPYVLRSSN